MTESVPSLNIQSHQPMIMETLLMAPTSHVVKHDCQTVTHINRGVYNLIKMIVYYYTCPLYRPMVRDPSNTLCT